MMGKPLQPPSQYTCLARDQKYGKKSCYESKAKGVSISASIFSIIIYISVFYLFNLSPSLVLNSSKFWFFLCNTLIIIIAADYGSFSSSCDRVDDPYDEYVDAASRQPMSAVYHQPYYYTYTHTTPTPSSSGPLHLKNSYHDEEEEGDAVEVKNMIFSTLLEPKEEEEDDDEEVIKEVIEDETWTVPTQDSIWESISNKADDKVRKEKASHRYINKHHADKHRKKVKRFRRTASEKLPQPTYEVKHERRKLIHRWDSERHDNDENEKPELQEEIGVDDEFGAMTNEELNRRVEEFIQKFNRHIRHERNINF